MAMNDAKRKKMEARKKKLKESSEGGAFFFVKANETSRIRPLPVDENEEIGMELITFYLGDKFKRVVSPATFGEPCGIMEKYNKIKDKDPELAKKIKPKKMYGIPSIKYDSKDGKGGPGPINSMGAKLALMTPGAYQTVVDYSLDSEHGDPSDPKNGFDLKWSRVGTGMTDTEYTIMNCKPTPLDKKYNKVWDTAAMIRKEVPSYKRTKEIIDEFLGDDSDRSETTTTSKIKKGKPVPAGFKRVIRDGKAFLVKIGSKKGDL